MLRRQFLSAAIAGLAAGGLARVPLVHALDGDTWLKEFHRARGREPWLAGWDSLDGADFPRVKAMLTGRLPKPLSGTLFRNGPALSERAGLRYHHWFDGDGMVQAWRIGNGAVSHEGRMVRTVKFEREQKAGRFVMPAAGTRIADAAPVRNNDDLNTANTALIAHRGELLALWEGGSPWRLDPENLQTLGPKSFRDDLAHVPFSAHPLVDSDGSLWNFGLIPYGDSPQLVIWHIAASGEVLSLNQHPLPFAGYLHSFSASAGHLVFVISPWVLDGDPSTAYFEGMQWKPELGSHVLVVPKNDTAKVQHFETEAGLAFHWADAVESNGQLHLRGCWYDNAAAVDQELNQRMRGRMPDRAVDSRLVMLDLDLKQRGKATLTKTDTVGVEFPHHVTENAPCIAVQGRHSGPAHYTDTVVAINKQGSITDAFEYGADYLVEEHLYVAQGEGHVIGTAFDWKRGQMCLSVFAATRLRDGPLFQARVARSVPLGFHGTYLAG